MRVSGYKFFHRGIIGKGLKHFRHLNQEVIVFHILDRKKLADEFVKHQELLENKKFFVQVNLGMEDTKSGISPEE